MNTTAEQKMSIRVRFYPTDTDETFDGTVIEVKPNFYVVIPDENLQLTQNWNKKRCDVIKSVCVHNWEKKYYEDGDYAMQCTICKEIR